MVDTAVRLACLCAWTAAAIRVLIVAAAGWIPRARRAGFAAVVIVAAGIVWGQITHLHQAASGPLVMITVGGVVFALVGFGIGPTSRR